MIASKPPKDGILSLLTRKCLPVAGRRQVTSSHQSDKQNDINIPRTKKRSICDISGFTSNNSEFKG
jgi:hypothetical protein